MYAACFVDNNSQNAKRLANRKFPPAIFGAALAVMDMNSGKMLKHRQLIHNDDPAISETWSTSSANEFGRLFQGVGNKIKDPTNTCHFIPKGRYLRTDSGTSRTGSLNAQNAPKKQRNTERASLWEAIE